MILVGLRAGFNRADDRGLERRIAFLEVHRDLRIADVLAHRPHEGPADKAGEDGDRKYAEGDNRAAREAEGLEPAGGEQQREQRARDHDHGAARREFQAPAIAHSSNDVDELQALIHAFLRKGQSNREKGVGSLFPGPLREKDSRPLFPKTGHKNFSLRERWFAIIVSAASSASPASSRYHHRLWRRSDSSRVISCGASGACACACVARPLTLAISSLGS